MFLSPMHKKHNNLLDRQEERGILKFLTDRKITLDNMKQFLTWMGHHRLNPSADQITNRELEYLLSYYNLDLKHPAYSEEKQPKENDSPTFPKNLRYEQIFRDPMEESILDSFREKYIDFNHEMGTLHHEGGREAAPMHPAPAAISEVIEPEFTYKFDDSNLKEKHPFAVKPNDPRYYGEAPFSSGKHSHDLLICILSEFFKANCFLIHFQGTHNSKKGYRMNIVEESLSIHAFHILPKN